MSTVLVIVANGFTGDPRATRQVAALQRAGHEVVVYGIRDRPNGPARFTFGAGATVVLLPFRGLAMVIAVAVLCLPLPALLAAMAMGAGTIRVGETLLAALAAVPAVAGIMLGAAEMVRSRAEAGVRFRSRAVRAMIAVLGRPRVRTLMTRCVRQLVFPMQEALGRRRIRRESVRLRPHIVHCHDVYTLRTGAAVKASTGAALVFDAHEVYEHMARRCRRDVRRYRAILAQCAAACDGFVTVNGQLAKWYAAHYPDLPPAVVVPNAIERQCEEVYDGRLHRAARLPADQRILLYPGHLLAERGLEKLVRAGAHLPPGWTLVLMGPGELRQHLETIASEEARKSGDAGPAGARVRFLPAVASAELPRWIRGATVGVIPYEPTCLNHEFCSPNKLWEFPSVDVPILATDLPNQRAAIEAYGMGWIIPAGAGPQAIAAAVARLDGPAIEAAREGCRRFMAAENWTVYERRLLALYASLHAAARVPARRGVHTHPGSRSSRLSHQPRAL